MSAALRTEQRWEANGRYIRTARTANGGGLLIAVLPSTEDGNVHNHEHAAVIAAAPDLLEGGIAAAGALHAAVEIMRECGLTKTAAKLNVLLQPLLAAVAKATGAAA